METFGAEVRRLREIGEVLTAHHLGVRAGLSAQFICDVEHGRRVPNPATAERLIAALGVVPDATQHLRELAFLARGECCPRCGFGEEE